MAEESDEVRRIIKDGLAALKYGDKKSARRLAEQAAALSPQSISPWLILSAVSNPSESIDFAKKALLIDPKSSAAREAYAWALKRQYLQPEGSKPVTPQDRIAPAFTPESPQKPNLPPNEPKVEPSQEPFLPPIELETEFSQEQRSTSGQSLFAPDSPISPARTELPERERKKIPFLPIFLGIGILALVIGSIFLRPRLSSLISRLIRPVPTPQCIQPELKMGNTQWPIKSIPKTVDGSIPIPAQTEDAYWLEGTTINYVFEFSPLVASTTSLANLNIGDAITLTWADCTTDNFVVNTIAPNVAIDPSILDQVQGGVTVLFLADSSIASLMIQGVRPETLNLIATETIDVNSPQAEISFIDQTISADGKMLTLTIAIKNTGASTISIAENDISLAEENATPLAPLSVDPGLPQKIPPGASQTLILAFPKPGGNTAVFRILDFSVDLYY